MWTQYEGSTARIAIKFVILTGSRVNVSEDHTDMRVCPLTFDDILPECLLSVNVVFGNVRHCYLCSAITELFFLTQR